MGPGASGTLSLLGFNYLIEVIPSVLSQFINYRERPGYPRLLLKDKVREGILF